MIRDCRVDDAPAIHAIYSHHVQHTTVTFEILPVRVDEMARRIEALTAKYPWLVWEEDGVAVGYACAAQWKTRCAFLHTVEAGIYIAEGHHRRGIGSQLYAALFDRLRAQQIHSVIAGVALPNDASLALHRRCGFRDVGRFSEVGRKFDQWIDVAYFELILDETKE